jgi:O-antigen/teichoic acid export membrane protein
MVLLYGVPLVPITVATWATTMSNRLFINHDSGTVNVGLFSAGNKVAQIMFLAVTAFSLAWGPFAWSIAEEPDARRTYAKVLTYYVAVLGWLALVLSLFAPLILEIARPSYARAYQVVAPLSLAYLVAGAYNIVAIGASLSRKTIHLSWTTVTAAVVAVLLNVLLLPLPYMALVGGALATLFGNLVWVGLVYMVSQKLYPIPYERGKVLSCVTILGVLVVAGQFVRSWLGAASPTELVVCAVLVLGYPLLLVAAGVIERYEAAILRNSLRARARLALASWR